MLAVALASAACCGAARADETTATLTVHLTCDVCKDRSVEVLVDGVPFSSMTNTRDEATFLGLPPGRAVIVAPTAGAMHCSSANTVELHANERRIVTVHVTLGDLCRVQPALRDVPAPGVVQDVYWIRNRR